MKNYIISLSMPVVLCNVSINAMQSYPSSADLINKFTKLVALTKEKPLGTAEKLYVQLFDGGRPFRTMFEEAVKTGLVEQYKQILLGTNSHVQNLPNILEAICAPDVLRMIAYLQNVYGGGQPFSYDSVVAVTSGVVNPSIGTYQSPKGKLNITSYGFLRGLIDAIDSINVSVRQNPSVAQTYYARLQTLNSAIDAAIAEQQKINTSAHFDYTVSELRKLVYQGNNQIVSELETILNKYKK
jgi:hypothetical protein